MVRSSLRHTIIAETIVFPPSSKPATVTPSTGVRAKVKRGNQKFENIEPGELVAERCGKVDNGNEALQVLEGSRTPFRTLLYLDASSLGHPHCSFKNSLTRILKKHVS